MVYRGRVENGCVRLEDSSTLPEGAIVEVRLASDVAGRGEEKDVLSLYERLKEFVGKAEGLPADASVNLDHYLYGQPKRQ